MRVLGVILSFILVCSAALASESNAPDYSRYYDQLFEDGKLDITVALGYEQKKHESDVPVIGPVISAIGSLFKGAQRDEEFTKRDVDDVNHALMRCSECDFRVVSRKNGEIVYSSQFAYKNRLIQTRVRFIFSLAGVKREALKKAFLGALKNDDVILYIGHARDGRGFPDFSSPLGDTGKIFINDEFGGWLGFEKGLFHPTKYQILSVHACKTDRYFTSVIRKKVWEKEHSKLALIMTSDDSWFEDYPGTTVAFIRGLILQLAREEILMDIEAQADYYRRQHAGERVIKPLFVADGFFDERYAKYSRPKRKLPKEPWRDMPF